MRWILALIALAGLAWYLNGRRRRLGSEQWTPPAMPDWQAQRENLAGTARDAQSQAAAAAGAAADKASETAQTVGDMARQGMADAAENVQQAAGAVTDRAHQAAQTAAEGMGQAATSAAEGMQQAATTSAAGAVETDVDTPAPSIRDAVQAEMANVAEKVSNLRDSVQAPPDRAEKSAGEAFGAGTMSATEMNTAMAPSVPGEEQVSTQGQVAGAADVAAPTGAGGPTAPPPDAPGTPTTGMEQAPEIDREEVLERTSGNFIGNKSTRVFHAATANNLPAEDNRVYFETEEEAVAAGFRPAAREGLESAES